MKALGGLSGNHLEGRNEGDQKKHGNSLEHANETPARPSGRLQETHLEACQKGYYETLWRPIWKPSWKPSWKHPRKLTRTPFEASSKRLEGLWKASGRPLEGLWKPSGRPLEGLWKPFWKPSGSLLEGSPSKRPSK